MLKEEKVTVREVNDSKKCTELVVQKHLIKEYAKREKDGNVTKTCKNIYIIIIYSILIFRICGSFFELYCFLYI